MIPSSCRVCLSSDSEKLESLFSNDGENTYADLIAFSCGIEIKTKCQLPQKICFDCVSQIKSACSIKRRCLETDELLRQKLSGADLKIELHGESSELIEPVNSSSPGPHHFPSEFPPSKEDRYQSVAAKRQTTKPSKIERNENKKPKEEDYRCFICERVFDLVSAKDLHVKQDHADTKLCKICNKRKQTAISLENHLKFHFFGYRFLCSCCGKSFRFRNLLENHLKVEHYNAVRFCCDLCLYETKFKINLERHVKSVHMKLKNFKCYKCADHEYSTQVGLNLHLYRVHEVQAPVCCSGCLQGFTFESELRVHKKHCTGSSIRLPKTRPQDGLVDIVDNGFRCRVCLQVYDTRSKWSAHYHHKHRNSNVCTICDKQMASSTSLFKHIQVQHNKIKRFQCDVCLKSFGFKHSLESHRNTHTGEKPFSCSLCNFRSGDRSTISKHKKKMHADI